MFYQDPFSLKHSTADVIGILRHELALISQESNYLSQ